MICLFGQTDNIVWQLSETLKTQYNFEWRHKCGHAQVLSISLATWWNFRKHGSVQRGTQHTLHWTRERLQCVFVLHTRHLLNFATCLGKWIPTRSSRISSGTPFRFHCVAVTEENWRRRWHVVFESSSFRPDHGKFANETQVESLDHRDEWSYTKHMHSPEMHPMWSKKFSATIGVNAC